MATTAVATADGRRYTKTTAAGPKAIKKVHTRHFEQAPRRPPPR